MFQRVLDPQRYALEIASIEMLTAEVVSLVEQQGVELICIAALPPGTTTPTRYLCKRLRTRFPRARSRGTLGGLGRATPIGRCSSRPGPMRWA